MPKVTLTERVKGVEVRVDNLENWQKRQNGSLLRMDAKFDRMIYLHFAELASVICFAWYMGRCLR